MIAARIPGRWPRAADHGEPHAEAVPHAPVRPQRAGGEEPVLVLPEEDASRQEGQRRGGVGERGTCDLIIAEIPFTDACT